MKYQVVLGRGSIRQHTTGSSQPGLFNLGTVPGITPLGVDDDDSAPRAHALMDGVRLGLTLPVRDAGTNCTHDYDAALLQLRTVGAAARATARR